MTKDPQPDPRKHRPMLEDWAVRAERLRSQADQYLTMAVRALDQAGEIRARTSPPAEALEFADQFEDFARRAEISEKSSSTKLTPRSRR